MSRLTYLVFNLLLVCMLYVLARFSNTAPDAVSNTVMYFSVPYILLNFLMAAFSLIRWFMKQNQETADEGITFLHNTWLSALFTYIAYELTGSNLLMKAIEYCKAHI